LLTVRYDYEEVESAGAEEMMEHLRKQFADSKFAGSSLKSTTSDSSFTVDHADDFSYTDPIDGSVSTKQGLFIKFTDGSRIIFRLSGTGSSGATVRLYVERYSKNESEYGMDAQDGLKPLIEVALEVSKLKEFTGREKPTVITVSPMGKVSCKVLMYSNQWSIIEYMRKRVSLDRECMNCE
jgi:phosphoglucomutase